VIKKIFILSTIASILIFALFAIFVDSQKEIKVLVLHSLTGAMASSEVLLKDTTLFAIDEINRKDKLLNHKITPIVIDIKSDISKEIDSIENILKNEKISAVFGIWTSSDRKTLKPIIEKYNNILFYPVQYEGFENSKNIIYNSLVANQQLIPSIKFALERFGDRFFLVGSDYIYPRVANKILNEYSNILGARVVGESYIKLKDKNFTKVIEKLKKSEARVIFNNINGDSNRAFYKALNEANITLPIISFSMGVETLREIENFSNLDNYLVVSYLKELSIKENSEFLKKYKKPISSFAINSYINVKLWEKAVKMVSSFEPERVLKAIKNITIASPAGFIYIDGKNNHAWRTSYIINVLKDSSEIVWDSGVNIKAEPYLNYALDIDKFIEKLYFNWGENWKNSKN